MNRWARGAWIAGWMAACAVARASLELDERPAEPGDWGYRPDRSSAPETNPPGFVWRPTQGAVGYQLQVGSEPDFGEIVYESETIRWSAHCPPVSLKPGALHWRYRAKGEDGEWSGWSKARAFNLRGAAPPWPQPALEELERRMPKGRPRLFFRSEDVAGYQALARGELAERWKRLLAEADQILAEPPDTSDPPKYPPEVERKSGEWKKIWWGNRKRMIDVVEGAATLAFAWRLTGEDRYGQGARGLLMAFAAWDPQGATNWEYNDEAAMPALYMGARAADWAWPILSDSERAKLAEAMRERGRQCFEHLHAKRNFLWKPYDSHANRAWHFLGETAIAFHGVIPEAPMWLDFAMTKLFTTYPAWGDSDGGWHEGVAYWTSYLSLFVCWSDALRSAFGIDVFERPFFKATGDFGLYTLPPGTKAGGFGDQAELMSAERIGDLMANLAVGARNPRWKWHAEKAGGSVGEGYLGFMRAARGAGLEPKEPAGPASKVFDGAGVAVLNSNLLDGTDNTQLFFKSSRYGSQSHGFDAQNSFLLHVNGRPIFSRTGRREVHGSPHHTQWMWSTRSGNSILVDGQGQKKHTSTLGGTIIASTLGGTLEVVTGEAGEAYEGRLSRWERRIAFIKPRVIVIHDVLDAPQASTFQWLLHAPGKFEIGPQEAAYRAEHGEARIRFLEPPGLAITQTDQYDPPPADWAKLDLGEWHLTADAAEKTTHREFIAVIGVGEKFPEVALETQDGRRRLTVDLDGEKSTVEMSASGFEVRTPRERYKRGEF